MCDERSALAQGVLGQETTGAGGVTYGLRTVPVAVRLARTVREVAPQAWVINFTNPAGMVTQAMAHPEGGGLGDRVVGICDSPVGLMRRVAYALGVDPRRGGLRLRRAQPPRLAAPGRGGRARPAARPARRRRRTAARSRRGRCSAPTGCARWARCPTSTSGTGTSTPRPYAPRSRPARAGGSTWPSSRRASMPRRGRRSRPPRSRRGSGPGTSARRRTWPTAARPPARGTERATADLDGGGYDRMALALMRAIAHDERRRWCSTSGSRRAARAGRRRRGRGAVRGRRRRSPPAAAGPARRPPARPGAVGQGGRDHDDRGRADRVAPARAARARHPPPGRLRHPRPRHPRRPARRGTCAPRCAVPQGP